MIQMGPMELSQFTDCYGALVEAVFELLPTSTCQTLEACRPPSAKLMCALQIPTRGRWNGKVSGAS